MGDVRLDLGVRGEVARIGRVAAVRARVVAATRDEAGDDEADSMATAARRDEAEGAEGSGER